MTPMSQLLLVVSTFAAAGCQQPTDAHDSTGGPRPAIAATAEHPVVVELYQSQGCSSCPPANAALNAIADEQGVIALSFAVTYWDRLGWKDSFAKEAFTQRQYDYARALGNMQVATPQTIINGRTVLTGFKPGELARRVASEAPLADPPSISIVNRRVDIGKGTGNADVLLVRYDPRIHRVAIRSGENSGRTLPHRNIVRELVRLGKWRGDAASLLLPNAADTVLKSVILIQVEGSGAIIAARTV